VDVHHPAFELSDKEFREIPIDELIFMHDTAVDQGELKCDSQYGKARTRTHACLSAAMRC